MVVAVVAEAAVGPPNCPAPCFLLFSPLEPREAPSSFKVTVNGSNTQLLNSKFGVIMDGLQKRHVDSLIEEGKMA